MCSKFTIMERLKQADSEQVGAVLIIAITVSTHCSYCFRLLFLVDWVQSTSLLTNFHFSSFFITDTVAVVFLFYLICYNAEQCKGAWEMFEKIA